MDYYNRAKQFRTKKRLGQNFLVDGSVIDFIIDNANLSKDDTVVEIGPGAGFVTERLVQEAGTVHAIELDEDAVEVIKKINTNNLNIIHNDVLKVDFEQFGKNLKIVANIPYYITSPILAHLLGEIDDLNNKNRNCIDEIILMVQYEVAQRLVATEASPSKQYGLLTILAQFYSDVEIIKKVPSKCFFPRPKVDSALVKFKVKKSPLIQCEDYKFFRKVLKAAFAARRKNIKNCLTNAGFDKAAVQKTLEEMNIPENARGESLSIQTFGELADKLKANLCNK
ncbi:ribosomal RNA small subunit methyltransferase A [bacterium]|nr:ribosomal RNA small subunit methyltransferase A [bacterium]